MHPDHFSLLVRLADNSADITQLSQPDRARLAWLRSQHYVEIPMQGINVYTVTDSGFTAIEDYRFLQKQTRRSSLIEWIRYSITTAIALAAIVISIFALLD